MTIFPACLRWKMVVVEDLLLGNDGLIPAARLRQLHGYTSRKMTNPLEVNETG